MRAGKEPDRSVPTTGWAVGVAAAIGAAGLMLVISACSRNRPPRSTDTIWDSPILDRRVEETPRQRTMRQCKQETERFRVKCAQCHTTKDAEKITAEDLKLTKLGHRARVMRQSVTFGKHTHCTRCHTTQFGLTSYAQRMFGPNGEKHRALEAELNRTTIK